MDDMEASHIFYIKVGLFDQHEQSKVCLWFVTELEIVKLTVQYIIIFSIGFMYSL